MYYRDFRINGYLVTEEFRIVRQMSEGVYLAHSCYHGDFQTLKRSKSCFYVSNADLSKYYRTSP